MDIGTNVKQLEVGDEVWVSVPFWYPGLLSQVALVSESKVARKPKSIGYVGACSLPYAGSVALETLDHLNLNQETSVGKRCELLIRFSMLIQNFKYSTHLSSFFSQ